MKSVSNSKPQLVLYINASSTFFTFRHLYVKYKKTILKNTGKTAKISTEKGGISRRVWWARVESNHRPPGYEPEALTKLSYEPRHKIDYNIPHDLCQEVQEMVQC